MGSNNVEDQPPTSNLGSTKGLVTINPAKTYKDDAALTADTVIAEVELVATSSTTVREGLDLVAVLDISGSMSGVKIDSVKKAMAFVIMKLTPVDRLSIVTFSDAANTVTGLRSMTPANQTDLIAKVNGLNAGGGTHIQAGLEAGLAVLSSRTYKTARAANIFLMSDGDQTSGDARLVNPGQVPIYTFGFGKDANHQLMSDIATKSPGGTFSSVPDGSPVTVTFSQLLAGLLTIVAQDVQLILNMSSYTIDTESIVVSPGIDYTQTTDAAGDVTIKFGNLFAGEKRRVQMTIKLKDITETYTDDDGFTATLAEAQHRFTAQGKPSNLQTGEYINIYRTKTPSQAPGTSAKEREVQAEMARLQHADAIKQARVLADGGKLDDARYKLVDAQNALEDMVPLGDGQRLVNALRAELVQLIKLMDSEAVYNAQGRPYALASETCHGRQRYAARGGGGGGDDVRLFATPRMDAYREQAQSFEKDPTAPVPTADEDVKKEVAANPLAAISTELAFYLRNAIQALQAIERIVAPKA